MGSKPTCSAQPVVRIPGVRAYIRLTPHATADTTSPVCHSINEDHILRLAMFLDMSPRFTYRLCLPVCFVSLCIIAPDIPSAAYLIIGNDVERHEFRISTYLSPDFLRCVYRTVPLLLDTVQNANSITSFANCDSRAQSERGEKGSKGRGTGEGGESVWGRVGREIRTQGASQMPSMTHRALRCHFRRAGRDVSRCIVYVGCGASLRKAVWFVDLWAWRRP